MDAGRFGCGAGALARAHFAVAQRFTAAMKQFFSTAASAAERYLTEADTTLGSSVIITQYPSRGGAGRGVSLLA